MDNKKFITNILNGEASAKEIEYFSIWIKDAHNKNLFFKEKRLWHLTHGYTPSKLHSEMVLASIMAQTPIKKYRNIKYFIRLSPIAAVLLIAAVIGYFIVPHKDIPLLTQTTYIEPTIADSSNINLLLSDSTIIDLSNTLSTIKQETNGTTVNVQDGSKITYAENNISDTKNNDEIIYNSIYIPAGKKYTLQLSDGTIVYMNSSSSLRYPVKFGDIRDVSLSGQAYFIVAKDKERRPFIVNSKDFSVRAISTEFDVCSYPDDDYASMVMVEGKVEVSNGDSKTICIPDNMYVYERSNGISHIDKVDSKYITLWKDGLLIIDNIPFIQLIRKLEMWYGIKVCAPDEKYNNYRFNGEFDKADLNTAVLIIENNLNTDCELVNNTLIIK